MKAVVVYIADTGHVLGTVTRASGDEDAPPIADLVNEELLTNAFDRDFAYPASALAAVKAELELDALLEPTSLWVSLDASGTRREAVGQTLGSGGVTQTYDKAKQRVRVSCQPVGATKRAVYVQAAGKHAAGQLLAQTAQATRLRGNVSIALDPKDPYVVFVDGFTPIAGTVPP